MPAITETAGTRRYHVTGQLNMIKADVSSVDDADTWTPGLSIIEFFSFRPTAAAATTQWAATWTTPANRQAVVTFDIESGSLAGTVVAYGH